MTTEVSIFDRPTEVPEEFHAAARERGWPPGALERACELRMPKGAIQWWLEHEQPRDLEKFLEMRRMLMFGTMRARLATWQDDEPLSDLYANSPEEIGDWEVTVQRGPYPYAQFRLQEHVGVSVLEDRGVILAATADSSRNTLVGGKRSTVHIASAWRVHKDFRGQGLSRLLRMTGGPPTSWFGFYNYYYVRSQNFGALGWINTFIPDAAKAPEREGDVPGIPITVHRIAGRRRSEASGIRLARPSDVKACLRLINRTHRGCDLFRPYTEDFLEERLNDPCWGDKPPFWVPVYGWPDYFVLEENGRAIACGGLWDKGKNVREVWRHKETGEERTLDSAALLDFGYARGREDAMARLIAHFADLTADLGRSHLAAAVEHLPRLVHALQPLELDTETRSLHWQLYDPESDRWAMDYTLKRPYTDLAYW